MSFWQKQWELTSRSALTRRDAFGLVLLASIIEANFGSRVIWIFLIFLLVPEFAWALSALTGKVGQRVLLESQVVLYPVLLLGLGFTGIFDSADGLLISAGSGWLLRIAIQRLVAKDVLALVVKSGQNSPL
ncbi:hypothetical protein G7066_01635 [Leucobacter coleopterorum]|uniref:Uncharacterized protein n=1 Tax=Leucobacter coleopterorum TaxID=2714933 RepID=A0ABX6JY07_9MICO|nr:hypothetical protein [Leucobacter coleopterorum]QIM17729.1 hypothetical protein G7066_01635 [Leucobacter coleopterorum]